MRAWHHPRPDAQRRMRGGGVRPAIHALLMAVLLLPGPAFAAGMRIDDLTQVEAAARDALGEGAISRAERGRLILACPGCDGAPTVDVQLGRQDDGTEARVRSGETTAARLEALCRARQPECRLERRDVGPAVGWMTSYRVGEGAGGTLILLRDGDLLLVRAIAASPDAVRRSIDLLVREVVPAIVGR